MKASYPHLGALARRFEIHGDLTTIEELPGGHINASYRVGVRRDAPRWYLLQRLNPDVFPDCVKVMRNVSQVTRHLAARHRDNPGRGGRHVLTLVPTTTGGAWLEDAAGACWRMYGFITDAHVRELPDAPGTAYEAARAYGEFLGLLADYDGPPLHETIPRFHDTAERFARLERAAVADTAGRLASARAELDAALAHRGVADILPPLMASGAIPVRIAHNDAKLSNVLLDDHTGRAKCVVDLDTVMPGSALHDFGDMVRSMTTPTGEDEPDLLNVGVRYELFEAVARGYLEEAGASLTPAERAHLVAAGRIITLEQGVRFLTDYLEGDRYYRDVHGDQNLRRARTQLRLFESLTHAEDDLRRIVDRL